MEREFSWMRTFSLYSAFDHPTFGGACRDFLTRVDQEEVHGYCSAFVLNEVLHKLMMSEIVDKFGVQAGTANNYSRKDLKSYASYVMSDGDGYYK